MCVIRAIGRFRRSWSTWLIIADTGTTAVANVLSLSFAARLLDSGSFSRFALLQLVVVTTAMIQRAFVLAPGLAAQRNHGRGVFTPTLMLKVSLPGAATVGIGVLVATGGAPAEGLVVLAASIAAFGALAMDVIRYCLLTMEKRRLMLAVNGIWTAVLISGIITFPPSGTNYLLVWGLSGMLIAGFSGIMIGRPAQGTPCLTVRQTWRLGKWSGIDAAMSACANLLPMFAATTIANGDIIGTYRLIQATMGPLNIISSSLITIYSVDAWKLASTSELERLNSRVKKYSWIMLAGSIIYMTVAEILVVSLSHRWSPETTRICLIVLLVGALGALTSSYSAGALALGEQRSGAILRMLIVSWSAGITAATSVGISLPWNDPIAPVTIFAATSGLVGWLLAYRRALHRSRTAALVPLAG